MPFVSEALIRRIFMIGLGGDNAPNKQKCLPWYSYSVHLAWKSEVFSFVDSNVFVIFPYNVKYIKYSFMDSGLN